MDERLAAGLKLSRVLWAALFGSTLLFAVVLVMQKNAGVLPAAPSEPIMLPVLGGVALVVAVVSLILPRRLHLQALSRAGLAVVEEVDESASVGAFRQSAPKIRVFADPKRARSLAVGVHQTAMIMGMALSEATVIFGLMLGFLGFEWTRIAAFWPLGWILMALRFPSQTRIISPLEKAYDARLR